MTVRTALNENVANRNLSNLLKKQIYHKQETLKKK